MTAINNKHTKILNSLDKARTAPRVLEADWDRKILPRTLKSIAKKYDLLGTCDTDNPVNTDPELADAFFKAGWEAALELGFYCHDTETIIKEIAAIKATIAFWTVFSLYALLPILV